MDIVDTIRAKQLGEAMLTEFEQFPRGTWMVLAMRVRRKEDGGIDVDGIKAIPEDQKEKVA